MAKVLPIKLLDVVILAIALPEYNLARGQVGTVAEAVGNGKAFEVEFSDKDCTFTSFILEIISVGIQKLYGFYFRSSSAIASKLWS
ncbi:DUF4926 domain-containing protein [Synechococcus sp. PCC 7502]|uniref:DUF4926 domain-containing protein n=1 Tax=Synechococcus sp. PCC 7502 TaxID=1173263 RepID=UPI00059D6D67|nr:DUF4926 domain-containing protein [Synechococcus sp. PCC 7502]